MGTWEDLGPRTLPSTHVYVHDSDAIGDRLQVTVAEPPLAAGVDPLPTLVVLDPIATLDIVIGVTRTLALLAMGGFPPVLVVGVGYDADPITTMSLRFRDLTPTVAPVPDGLAPPIPPTHGTGGADRFLAALADEVLPQVAARHRADTADATIVGWSLAGLFGMHALLTRPELFRRYVLASPSLWWDDAHVLRVEEATAARRRSLAAQVYVAVGDREETASTRSWPVALPPQAVATGGMVSHVETVVRRLRTRGTRGLDVHLEVLPDEHHVSIFPSAISRGLVHLFAGG